MEFLYDRADGSLDGILPCKCFGRPEFLSMFAQVLAAIAQMNSAGYWHNDIHTRNIAYTATRQRHVTVNLGGPIAIPTLGRHFVLIDYGDIRHADFAMTPGDRRAFVDLQADAGDIMGLLWLAFSGSAKAFGDLRAVGRLTPFPVFKRALRREPEFQRMPDAVRSRPELAAMLFAIKNPRRHLELAGIAPGATGTYLAMNGPFTRAELLWIFAHRDDPAAVVRKVVSWY